MPFFRHEGSRLACTIYGDGPLFGQQMIALHGLFFGRTAPHKTLRREIAAPALVIGHERDPIHPFSDSDALIAELPNARLVQASSILALRLRPERLTDESGDFLDGCWKARRRGGAPRGRRVA
jgi:pimeloyl-ACP methyl ester carboxylesterase